MQQQQYSISNQTRHRAVPRQCVNHNYDQKTMYTPITGSTTENVCIHIVLYAIPEEAWNIQINNVLPHPNRKQVHK